MRKIALSTTFGYVLLLFFAIPSIVMAQNQAGKTVEFELKDSDRVVFLGNSLFESDKNGYLELALTTRWPDKKVTFRNLGWEGDNVFGQARSHFTNPPTAYETLMQQITAAKPTIIFIAYGGVEAQDGAAGLDKFKDGLNKLLDKTDELGAKAILLSPIPVLSGIPVDILESRNKDLQLYAKAIADIAKARDKQFIDLYNPVTDFQKQAKISEDGIHLNEVGYYLMATALENGLGLVSQPQVINIQVVKSGLEAATPAKIVPSEAQQMKFTIAESYLPLPLLAAELPKIEQKRTVKIGGLKKGFYTLIADNVPVITASEKSWGAGIEIKQGGVFDQTKQIQHLINKKNDLFFQQYRPWNETYITGFRAYEQGRHKEGLADLEYIMVWLENQIYLNSAPKSIVYQIVTVK
ncbi:GDSL-type esterase/lipase family protein [Pedobacter sp. B4-66]|uniref:GDSL-type esterase/lipase family protein n=1 Tax=Pedobacter sp. B4-66 TaxID=2817280 RepID=UPI001BDA996D|nr:GDSL-type esterase/lipase family protein [Pedobacter sp. B4-66]